MKLYQHDKKIWDAGVVDHTWQFGIVKNKSFLFVNCLTNGSIIYLIYSSGGINILFSFFGCSLFGIDLQRGAFSLGFHFFTDYFSGWKN